jgi:hypothetical protein
MFMAFTSLESTAAHNYTTFPPPHYHAGMSNRISYAGIWLILILVAWLSPVANAEVSVSRVEYHGWKDAWRISNGACELVVVPQVNRVMSFALKDAPSALWNNPPLAGQVQLADDHQWHNFGGDKVWPTQQDWWERYTDRKGWPPPYTFDAAPATAEQIANGVRTTTQKSPDFGTRTVREFVMDDTRPLVLVRQWFDKEDGKTVTMSAWNVMQVRKPDYAILPSGKEIDGQPYKNLGQPIVAGTLKVHATVVSIRNDAQKPMKIGAVLDPAGKQEDWVGAVHGGQLVLESRALHAAGNYPDGGSPAQIYTAPARDGSYVECEMLSPMTELQAGQKLRDDMVWQLIPLTEAQAADPEQAGAAARAAHVTALQVMGNITK